MVFRRSAFLVLMAFLFSQTASAAVCVNRFLTRSEGGARQIVTLLTGKVTFQEAQALSRSSIEWVDENGKKIGDAVDLKVVRPMPVACDGKTSGVVMLATFLAVHGPSKKMFVKIAGSAPIEFTEQE